MNDQYPIGTICILQNCVMHPEFNETECVITGPLMVQGAKNMPYFGYAPRYTVRAAFNGKEYVPQPHQLRLPPPKHKEWADEAIRKLKKQSSDHVAGGSKHLIPEEAL